MKITARLVLLAACLGSTASCSTLGAPVMQLLALPFHLLGSVLGMAASNPIGTAATAATLL